MQRLLAPAYDRPHEKNAARHCSIWRRRVATALSITVFLARALPQTQINPVDTFCADQRTIAYGLTMLRPNARAAIIPKLKL